jgi:hypothetical protein
MAQDLLATKVSIGFTGGTITATRGLLEAVFGDNFVKDAAEMEKTVTRRAHTRRRVIGGPTSGVAGAQYTQPVGGTRSSGSALGGEAVRVLVDDKWWIMRLSGSHKAFNELLGSGLYQGGKVVFWKSEAGRTYGPYTSATTL